MNVPEEEAESQSYDLFKGLQAAPAELGSELGEASPRRTWPSCVPDGRAHEEPLLRLGSASAASRALAGSLPL